MVGEQARQERRKRASEEAQVDKPSEMGGGGLCFITFWV